MRANRTPALVAIFLSAQVLASPQAPALIPSSTPIPDSLQPATGITAAGDLGALDMPALALPAPKQLAVGLGVDYFRGGDFLLPGATIQHSGLSLGVAYAPLSFLETYGAIGFTSANRFGPSSRQTLTSLGDTDLGLKLVLPVAGPFTAGALLELDVPAGVGGFSLKGTGGRAAAMGSIAEELGAVPLVATALFGYVLDQSYKLLDPIGTFPAYALNLSLYDRVQGQLSLQSPLRYAAPVAELQVEVPVARGLALPPGDHPARVALFLGATAIRTGVPGLTASAGVALSLTRTGRVEADSLPMAGFAPDSPWRALASVSYSFEPKLPGRRTPVWRAGLQPQTLSPAAQPPPRAPLLGQAVGTGLVAEPPLKHAQEPPIPEGRGRIVVIVLDSRTQAPLSNAWVSAIELADLGTTTGPDGRALVDALPGPVTLAVAHDGYDPYSDHAEVEEGKERELVVTLQTQLADSTVHGRIIGEDGKPLRATVELQPIAGGASSGELEIFEGRFSIARPPGAFNLVVRTPGYRADPFRLDLVPGEVASRDVVLHRIPGEPVARLNNTRVELSERLEFVPATAQLTDASLATLAEVAAVLRDAGPVTLGVRLAPSELSLGQDELTALLLAEDRAQAVASALVAQGIPRNQLAAHGQGIAREGQPLFEIRRGILGKPAL